MTFWMMTGAATVLKIIQKPTTATPMVFCKSGKRGSRINIFKAGVGHEIENALGDERGERPAQRPQQNADKIHEVAVAGVLQRRNCHETDEQGRERVAEIQDDRLKDVSPEHHQRSELSDEPEDGGDDQVGGKIVELRHDIPPGRLCGRVAFDDEQMIELLIDVGRVNAQAGEDGSLQQILQRVAPGRQEHEQAT